MLLTSVFDVPITKNFNSFCWCQTLAHFQSILLLFNNLFVFSLGEHSIIGCLGHVELLDGLE